VETVLVARTLTSPPLIRLPMLLPPSSYWRNVVLARWLSSAVTDASQASSPNGTSYGCWPSAVLEQPVGQVMTRKVVTCTRADTMSSIMELMTVGKFRHLPVVESDQLIGIISIGDVVKHRAQQIEFESAALRDYIRTT